MYRFRLFSANFAHAVRVSQTHAADSDAKYQRVRKMASMKNDEEKVNEDDADEEEYEHSLRSV